MSLSVSATNSSFLHLKQAPGASTMDRYFGAGAGGGDGPVLCHKREKMTTVGDRVVRLILYQTVGW